MKNEQDTNRHRSAAPPSSTGLGFPGDHLFDRGLAVGPSRADRRAGGGGDSAGAVQAMVD